LPNQAAEDTNRKLADPHAVVRRRIGTDNEVSAWTGMPVDSISWSTKRNSGKLKQKLLNEILGG